MIWNTKNYSNPKEGRERENRGTKNRGDKQNTKKMVDLNLINNYAKCRYYPVGFFFKDPMICSL